MPGVRKTMTDNIYTKCAWCGEQYRRPESREWVELLPGVEDSWIRRGWECSHGICPRCKLELVGTAVLARREQGGGEEEQS